MEQGADFVKSKAVVPILSHERLKEEQERHPEPLEVLHVCVGREGGVVGQHWHGEHLEGQVKE